LEFIGRNDTQVKIRGFRIELSEIEAQLRTVPGVKNAIVVALESASKDRYLAGYVIPDVSPSNAAQQPAQLETISQWQQVHDTTYSSATSHPSFIGWNSSFNAEPIPKWEMHEWLEHTLARI